MPRPAVFLDRDGTLIEDREYLSDPAGVRLFAGVGEALEGLRDAGFALVVITNQSGIGRGWMSIADYELVAAEFERQLASVGIQLDATYYCPAGPAEPGCEEHPDRKPNPGLYLKAARELDLDLPASYAVGDSLRDLIAGQRAGCRAGILVRTGKPTPALSAEWMIVDNISAAATWILSVRGSLIPTPP